MFRKLTKENYVDSFSFLFFFLKMIIANVPTAHPQKSSENPDSCPGINPTKEMNIIATKANPINSKIFIIPT